MKKKRPKISQELRNQITIELQDSGCDIAALAKKYQLARSTLLKYRQQHRKQEARNLTLQKKSSFVEVKLEECKSISSLTKVELSFDNYKCSVEGRLSSNQLLKLVQLLEEGAC